MKTPEKMENYTPEQLRKIYAQARKEFTVEKLIEYIEDDDEKFPARQVLAEVELMIQNAKSEMPESDR